MATLALASASQAPQSPERLLNLYAEPLPQGSRSRALLRSVLGQKAFTKLGAYQGKVVVNEAGAGPLTFTHTIPPFDEVEATPSDWEETLDTTWRLYNPSGGTYTATATSFKQDTTTSVFDWYLDVDLTEYGFDPDAGTQATITFGFRLTRGGNNPTSYTQRYEAYSYDKTGGTGLDDRQTLVASADWSDEDQQIISHTVTLPVGASVFRLNVRALGDTIATNITYDNFSASVSFPGRYAADPDVGARKLATVDGTLYAAGASSLLKIAADGSVSQLGAIADDVETFISGNGSQVTVAAGGEYYLWDGSALTNPSGQAFTTFGDVTFHNQYTVLAEKGGGQFQWSSAADPNSFDGLHFATAEYANDDLLRVETQGGNLWLFGAESYEVWAATGAGATAYSGRLDAQEIGLKSRNLLTSFDSGLFFIGDDNIAYIAAGTTATPVSTPGVHKALNAEAPSHVFYYEDRGHKMLVVRFASRPAWVFDFSTRLWHERSTGVLHGAWEVIDTAFAYGKWYCLTSLGAVYEMARTNADIKHPLRRTVCSQAYVSGSDRRFVAQRLVIRGTYGETDIGRDASLLLATSSDGGRSFSAERALAVGDLGDRTVRAEKRRMGQFRQFAVQVSITDPADINLDADAVLEAA
ncbi:MAG: hypothetical protein AAFQ36_09480 [Pseudomonadota bacterium]